MSAGFIPVNEPLLDGNEAKYLAECIDKKWISGQGLFVDRFEGAFAAFVGAAHGVAVSNGTDALEMAVAALGIGPGDEVILPTFTIISCVAAVVRAGATPVLVDCDPDTWNTTAEAVAAKATPRTRAIMPVHIYGLPVDMGPLMELARGRGIPVIEDASEAIGLTCRGRQCGGIGDIGVYSFYANKHITTGEGGMITTDDPALAERCRSLRNLCFGPRRFVHDELGWNMRLSNLQAAVGLAQLERIDRTITRKRAIGRRYTEALRGTPGIRLPVATTETAENVYWVYGIVLDEAVPFDAAEAMRRLAERGVDCRPFFWPMHEQPVLQARGLFAGERYPVAERLARRGFYLPSGAALTDRQIDRVVEELRAILA